MDEASALIQHWGTRSPKAGPEELLRATANFSYFCKVNLTQKSYYQACDTCVVSPVCCDASEAIPSEMFDDLRCTQEDYGIAPLESCAHLPYPPACPEPFQFFCQADLATDSYYSACDQCVSEPICCDVADADVAASGGFMCTTSGDAVADATRCAGLPYPAACPPTEYVLLQQQVAGLERNLTELGSVVESQQVELARQGARISSLEDTVSSQGGSISMLNSQVASQSGKIAALETQVSQLLSAFAINGSSVVVSNRDFRVVDGNLEVSSPTRKTGRGNLAVGLNNAYNEANNGFVSGYDNTIKGYHAVVAGGSSCIAHDATTITGLVGVESRGNWQRSDEGAWWSLSQAVNNTMM